MTAVFVHGNPETAAVWGPLLDELRAQGHDDLVCLSPPGFGAPRPAGFGATVGEYRDWLISELSTFDEPVDLVGHDWGGGHVMSVGMTRPDLLASWASDVLAVLEPDYVWHDLAQTWQTPGDGEAHVAEFLGGTHAERVERMVALGITRGVAEAIAPAWDEEMQQAIVDLYRSAAQPTMAELGAALPAAAARPGLYIIAENDHFLGTPEMKRRGSERAGARTAELTGVGHWWLTEDPTAGARVLDEFWRVLRAGG